MELARRGAGTNTSRGDDAAPVKPVKNFGLLRVDYDAFVRGAVEGDETCDLPGLGPVPVRIARELLGDAILKLVITNGIDVKNVTHLGRGPTVAQQVALWWESPTCRVLDCACTSRLQNDHRNDWTYVHETVFENLDPLCQHHHKSQDPLRLGPHRRHRTPTHGPTRRPPPPQIPRTTGARMTRREATELRSVAVHDRARTRAYPR
jgi:hypothetical protein